MQRGEIWLVRLDPTEGSEIAKTRPALIVSNDDIGILPLKVIVPITDWKERYANRPWMVKLTPDSQSGLTKDSAADCFQVRSISETRFVQKLGSISAIYMQKISNSLRIILNLSLES
ncbi:MAG: type II toxin-antitoxin system PemK/MazF family toxin [Cyanobacteriota bacterium]|nr:type II toxin-antitoxin system PemK/MazF family toxin [Cyanobacteriota bacterium]